MNNTDEASKQTQSQPIAPFLIVWTGQALSLAGSVLVQFVLVWWLTQTTESATVLALASMMVILPRILVSPFAGALIDRWNRRIVMIVADGTIALAVVVLAVLYALDAVQVWHVYLLMFIRAVGGAFHWPAMQASTALMAPEKHLSRVAGMTQAVRGLCNIVVPPVAAMLLELLPMQPILAIDVATAALAIIPLFFVTIPQPKRKAVAETTADQSSMMDDLREGLRFVWGWPALTIIFAIAATSNLLVNPALALGPLLIYEHFGGSARELGWMQSTFGTGFVVGALTLSVWGGFKRRIVTAYLARILWSVGLVVIGLTPIHAFPLVVVTALLIGFVAPIANGSLTAVIQAITPPDKQGRVLALYQSITGLMTPLGLAIAGPVGDVVGVPPLLVLAGIVGAMMGAGALFIPAIVQIEDKSGETHSEN